MTDLQTLTLQRDELLAKIREIEESCEGIENENNANRVQELNLEQAQLNAQKQELSAKVSALQNRLTAIGSEISKLSGTGINKILDAIKEQRWYFFNNKTKILLDRTTGLIWANLDYFPYLKNKENRYTDDEATDIVKKYSVIDDYEEWRRPSYDEILCLCTDRKNPFAEGSHFRLMNQQWWFANIDSDNMIDADGLGHYYYDSSACLILCCDIFKISNLDYENNVSPNNPNYTERERLQFTLDLFVQNDLWPIFEDEEITELYKKIYFEKPKLINELQEVQQQIESLQTVTLLSSEFDYTALLSKYDIKSINTSIIKYYQAVQQWTEELLEKLNIYEQEKEAVIQSFNMIGLKLSKKYETSDLLTEEENELLRDRQRYFAARFSLGMNSVKSKIISVKNQADNLEYRIDDIDNGDDAIHELALLEKEERASFGFIAENTAKIIRNALRKIEYFEENSTYVTWAINSWEQWTESYRVFAGTYREELRASCEEDGIEDEVWTKWYEDWQAVRFEVEKKFQTIIDKELRSRIPMIEEYNGTVAQQIIFVLTEYRNSIDTFFREERKGIYQNFAFQSAGDLQDKIETESRLYKLTAQFQSILQEIIFNCAKSEDRIYILNWANSLLDIQIDEVLTLIANNDLDRISDTILTEFSQLKQKNYEIYLADAKSYAEEQARRDKQFNSLLFKMRKGIIPK